MTASEPVVPMRTSPPTGCTTIAGASHGVTAIVIVSLSIEAPQLFVARTQYVDVAAGRTTSVCPVSPASAVVPLNHW